MSSLDVAMTATEAKQITTRINLLVTTITEAADKVVVLIEQAETGKAWQALGYPSWTAYVAGEFSGALAGLARAERVPITVKLAETGMSVRAIASVTGTSVGTVHNDVSDSGVQVVNTPSGTEAFSPPRPVTGMDGKSYLRKGRPTAEGMRDLAGAVPEVRRPSRRRPLPDAYRDAFEDLERALGKLERLTADDRFDGNRQGLAERYVAARWPELIGRVAVVAAALHPGVADDDD